MGMKCVDGAVTDAVGCSVLRCDRGKGLELGKEERRNHKRTKNDCRRRERVRVWGCYVCWGGSKVSLLLIAFKFNDGGDSPKAYTTACLWLSSVGGQSIISLPFCLAQLTVPSFFTDRNP